MTRLFIQFYLGILIVLFMAWYIHGKVLRHRADGEWARLVEEVHGGGARLVAKQIDAARDGKSGQENRENETADSHGRLEVPQDIRQRFDYPVKIAAIAELPEELREKLSSGSDVASLRREAVIVATLADAAHVVRLGPFPDYSLKGIEESLRGWMRLAAAELDGASPRDRPAVLARLQERFDIPIEIVPRHSLVAAPKDRLDSGDDVVFYSQDPVAKDRWFAATPLSNATNVVRIGPFPSFQRIEQNAATTTLTLVLLPAALAIAFMLCPVARQLRLVERTASAIAGGDFSARVDERRVSSARTLAQAFNNMAGRTETMLRTQRELLQAVSHELRTPLSRINFAIDLIRDSDDPAKREERLRSLEQAAQELDELVGELLGYVRMESGDPKRDLVTFNVLPVLETVIDKHALLFPSVQISLRNQLRDGPGRVCADAHSFERAIGNLLANAGRFARSKVEVGVRQADDAIVFDIDDDGPGVAPADRVRIFEPFVRIDESSRGAGLGLALVRRITTNHGGRVAALDSPLGGCRMQVRWPQGLPVETEAGDELAKSGRA